eukprot:gnl/MRDRNA2_/MRDRNA2_102273_c0_seq1.p1 gnl/MRDRNA2_/MRDRNA2_102273_c0~~gnl/MRDRNA2_/MRDRNA2_102273_c0_seq1.p1  ORF type:complete len:1263 (-),score=213.89 gnl/MRDRNA2_/MRDRNA2_102273_c0_seq1:34-3822(-)
MPGEEENVELPGSFASPRQEDGGTSSQSNKKSWREAAAQDELTLDSRPMRERFEPADSPKERPPKEEITLDTRPNRERGAAPSSALPPPGENGGSGASPSGAVVLPENDGQLEVYSGKEEPGSPTSNMAMQVEMIQSGIDAALRWYCQKLARFPSVFFLFWAVLLTVIVAAAWTEVVVDTDLSTFLEADSQASLNYAAFLEALKNRRSQGGLRVSDTSKLDFELHLLYQAKEVDVDKAGLDASSGILSEAALRDVRNFEQKLRELPGWKQLCDLVVDEQKHRCQPGESLSNYAWPTRDDAVQNSGAGELFGLSFNGLGKERLPNHATLAYLQTTSAGPHDLQKFFPRDFNRGSAAADVFRSHFTFTATEQNREEFMKKYEEFIVKDLYPLLTKQNDPQLGDYEFIRVFFAGDIIDGHEVRFTLAADSLYNVGAVVFAFLAAWGNTESLFLGMISTASIFSSIPLAHVMVPTVKTSIASFLSVFLMVGIGSDIAFYFTDLWIKSGHRFPNDQPERIYWAYAQCLRSCIPVVFTAASFFANLASVLRPLREFGLFMGACMLSSCIISLLVYFPALIMHTNVVRPKIHSGKVPKAVAMFFEPKIDMSPSPVQKLLTECLRLIQTGKNARWIIASIGILSFIFTIAAATTSQGGGRLPEIFPPDHNRHEGHKLLAGFAPTQPAINATTLDRKVCNPTGDYSVCSLHWCEAPVTPVADGSCECYKPPLKGGHMQCGSLQITTRIVGLSSPNTTFLYDTWMPYLDEVYKPSPDKESTFEWTLASNESTKLDSLVLEHWESGEVHVEQFIKLPAMSGVNSQGKRGVSCKEELMCYCGSRACQVENHWPTGKFEVFSGRRLESDAAPLAPARALSQAEVPAHLLTEVTVVFGLKPTESRFLDDGSKMWAYEESFEPSSPWAQRALREVCIGVPDNLKVRSMNCWISDFRLWLKSRGEPFPTRRFGDFHADVSRFMQENANPPSEVWFEDGKLKATAFTFKVGVAHNLRAENMLEYRDLWDKYLEERNEEASVTASAAWHTSPTWVRAESEVLIMQSSTHVVGIAVALGFTGVFIYTMDLTLTAFVMMQVMVIIAGLCFVMFVILGWSVGPLEVISLVVFVAYTVTPALHIARRFFFTLQEGRHLEQMALADAEPNEKISSMQVNTSATMNNPNAPVDTREERTHHALMLSGSTAMSCFAKTLGCSIFLLPATLWMFAKLGTVIFVVNLLSAGLTLILFPALCVTVGPKSDAPTLVLLYRWIKAKVLASQQ